MAASSSAAMLDALFRRNAFGIKLGLDAMQALLAELGHPERDVVCVHVAGTNGKGSVCAMLEAVLREAGLRPGLYTSPHLVRFHERIRIAGEDIGDAALAECLHAVTQADRRVVAAGGREATFFEFATAAAFAAFRAAGVRLVVLETGLGGRLDATNVVEPLCAVITGIGMDHAEQLGNDLGSIAREKGGIIKAGRPVVLGAMPPEAETVLQTIASERRAPCVRVGDHASVRRVASSWRGQRVDAETAHGTYGRLDLPLIGAHQLENLATALTTLDLVGDILDRAFDANLVRAALRETRWRGRLDCLHDEPPVLLDGGHNPDAGRAIATALHRQAGKRPVALIAGMLADKDIEAYLGAYGSGVRRCWAVPVDSPRAAPPERLARVAAALGWAVSCAPLTDALAAAWDWVRAENGVLCIVGSLYLAGEVLALEERNGLPWQPS